MAAPNAQPFGDRPGPKAPNEHAPHEAGTPATSWDAANKPAQGVAEHGTPGAC